MKLNSFKNGMEQWGTLTKRPRTKHNFVMNRPWDKTVHGTKQSLDKTSSANLRQNAPIFRDGLSVSENKTLQNFFGQNVPDPQKNFYGYGSPAAALSQGPFCSRDVPTRDVTSSGDVSSRYFNWFL
jgi:hypothetical protein